MVPQNQWEDEIDLGSVAGGCNLVISGPITSETISTLKSKLTAAGTSAKIHLDLSQTTGLTSIFYRAFYDCDRLSSVEIPAGVTSIGSEAFYDCDGLTSVEIPASVTSIGAAFYGCSGLTSVTFGEGSQLESIGDYAFDGCSGLTSVEIPASVTSIGSEAFRGCSGLTSVTFGEGSQLESIGYRAFYGCSGLASVEIPASVTYIGSYVFRGCSGLTSVTFGDISGWYVTTSYTDAANKTGGTAVSPFSMGLAANAKAELMNDTYSSYYWYKK